MDYIDKNNKKVEDKWETYINNRKSRGLFCCGEVEPDTLNRCLCVFVTESGVTKHRSRGKHKFPPIDLQSHIHLMHLSGKFAFSLATGSMANRAEVKSEAVLNDGDPDFELNYTGAKAFVKGCYRSTRADAFRASNYLIDDLEGLFQQGLRRDGPKQGSNKYTSEQALAFLRNLKMDNGRRKYSPDGDNEHGNLPTTSYITGWFSRRKRRMVEEELSNKVLRQPVVNTADNFQSMSRDVLRNKVQKILETTSAHVGLSEKRFMQQMLIRYDEINLVEERIDYKDKTIPALRKIFNKRKLPTGIATKPGLICFLRLDAKVERMRLHRKNSGNTLDRTIMETLAEESSILQQNVVWQP